MTELPEMPAAWAEMMKKPEPAPKATPPRLLPAAGARSPRSQEEGEPVSDIMCSNSDKGCENDVDYALCHACDLAKYEAEYKKAFDAGIEFQKKAAPTPRAKEYRDALKTCVEAAKRLVADAVSLAESGDAGCWDPDDDETIQAGRDAIAKAEALLR